jgi:hypothetical protein
MPPIPLADNFLAGSLISLLMPILLLVGLVVWYVFAVKRVPSSRGTAAPPGETVPTAPPPASAPGPGSETPGGQP